MLFNPPLLPKRRSGSHGPQIHDYDGQVAQSVEQGTENPRVGSSILSLATILLIKINSLRYHILDALV